MPGLGRTLINVLIVLALAACFVWAIAHVVAVTSGTVAPPVPRPTAPVGRIRVTATPARVVTPPHPRRTPTPTPVRPAPRTRPTPRPTPHVPPPVVVALTVTDETGATRFRVSALTAARTPRLYCRVHNSALPPGTGALTYSWTRDAPNGVLYGYTIARLATAYTIGYYQSAALATPGTYRCDVTVAGQPVGSARFSVVP